MPEVFIQGLYTILGQIKSQDKAHSFCIELSKGNIVNLEVNLRKKSIKSWQKADISDQLYKAFVSGNYNNLSEGLESELSSLKRRLSVATRRILELIKYSLNQVDIDERLISVNDHFWSEDNENWNRITPQLTIDVSMMAMLGLNVEGCQLIQSLLDADYQPFLAIRHLHRARKESIPRYKWIEATIAAELAIKEFLIRKKPELSALILYVPSPPMHRLYGSILEEYGGKKLDKKLFKALVDGAEVRNHLLHRPQDEEIETQHAINYVNNVAAVIKFLLQILYPTYHIVV